MLLNCCSTRMVFIWTLLVALSFGGVLLLAFWGMPRIIKWQVHKQTRLEQGTDQWDRFVELPFPIDYSIRLFNVSNAQEVMHLNATPLLVETEPYVYKLTLKKKDIKFDDDEEDSVTYDREMSFEFDESGTTKETDEVVIVNAVLLAALQLTNSIERLAFAGCIEKILTPFGMGEMFIKQPVGKILFEGLPFAYANYSDLGYACKIVRTRMLDIVSGIRVIEHIDNGDGNDYLIFSAFNYKRSIYTKDKPDGLYTVNRGIKDVTQLGNIMRWNGDTDITTWGTGLSTNNETCNQVGGTDSTIYKPQIDKNDELEIFNTDICRTVKLFYKSEETYQGIQGYRYETSPNTFRPSTSNPDNDCFCTKSTKDVSGNDNCYLDGLFDFKPCLGAPVLISQPHFLNADQHYIDAVKGLSPNESRHSIYLLLEPNTGTPMQGMKRIQLNAVMKQENLISFVTPKTMNEAVIPFLWLEEGVNLPEKYVDLLNNQYFNAVKIADGVKYGLIAIFASLLVVCLFFVWRKEYFKKTTV